MSNCACPWWMGYFLISPLRRLIHSPEKIIAPYVREGMIVLEPGPGMGFFTLELARKVGNKGRVIAIDLQPQMLEKLRKRAEKAQLLDCIETKLATPHSMGLKDLDVQADFAFVFAVAHELPDIGAFFGEVAQALAAGASLLLVEPVGHVAIEQFEHELKLAAQVGLEVIDRPAIRRSHAAILKKQGISFL